MPYGSGCDAEVNSFTISLHSPNVRYCLSLGTVIDAQKHWKFPPVTWTMRLMQFQPISRPTNRKRWFLAAQWQSCCHQAMTVKQSNNESVQTHMILRLFHHNSNLVKHCNPISGYDIGTKFCSCRDGTAVASCAKHCSDSVINIRIRAKWNFHHIWIIMQKLLVTVSLNKNILAALISQQFVPTVGDSHYIHVYPTISASCIRQRCHWAMTRILSLLCLWLHCTNHI